MHMHVQAVCVMLPALYPAMGCTVVWSQRVPAPIPAGEGHAEQAAGPQGPHPCEEGHWALEEMG